MATQFIIDGNGRKTAVIVPIEEYEHLLHHKHADLELTDEYKAMIDTMMAEEDRAEYLTAKEIKKRFKA